MILETKTDSQNTTMRRHLFEIMEVGLSGSFVGRVFDVFIIFLILINIAAVALETVGYLGRLYAKEFMILEIFSLSVFVIEYLVRVWVSVEYRVTPDAPGKARFRRHFIFSPLMIIDFIAIAPSLILTSLGVDLRVLRIFRFLRLFKLMRYSPALGSLFNVLYSERRALYAAFIVMIGLVVFSATVIHALEHVAQPEEFGNIPSAMWWALSTLTTVGYGDVVPITAWGKVFGGVVMIFGLGMYALPIGIIASGFANEIHQRDFVIRWGLVASVPLFSGLEAGLIQKITGFMRSSVVEKNGLIAMRGHKADKMFFVVSGTVCRKNEHENILLEKGGFFGAKSLLDMGDYSASYVAQERCHLFILEAREFHHLLDENPALKQKLKQFYRQHQEDFGNTEDNCEE